MKKIKISAIVLNILMFLFLTTSVVFLCYSLLDFSYLSIINIALDYFGIISITSWIAFIVFSVLTCFYGKKKRIRYLNCFFGGFCSVALFISGFLGIFESIYYNNLELSLFSSAIVLESYTCFGFVFLYRIVSMFLTMESPKGEVRKNNYTNINI